MLSINTNLSSLIAQQSMTSATNKLNQAIERMTTGYKINGAKDNAANYSISTNMTTKINSYMVAEDNVAMGLDMLSTANGSLDQISDKLTRL
ncbi:flagellin FliC, partial [bacterium]|nr:flagellin FliC [bacterium]